VRIDLGSMVVRDGTGGIKPLTDRDRREIAVTARKVLGTDRHPEARFSASAFEASDGGGVIGGNLTLAGATRPLRLEVSQPGPGRYRATTSVRQTQFGIKPYSAFLGSLKVRDAVDVEIDLDLSGAEQEPA
jgi:polyisoprenoid-binding protein YceI